VGAGAAGEIYIGGAGVALGYLNRPELTAERFIADPFAPNPQARLYKSGDLGRWRADGILEYLGRNDHQIKIRGFRIELGEIEARVTQHPQVADAIVMVHEASANDKQLVAYMVPKGAPFTPECEIYAGTELSPPALDSLRRLLSERAPLEHVRLLARTPAELTELEGRCFDALVLSSVQHFPDGESLLSALRGGLRLLKPGGLLFIGNILHLGWLSTLHSTIQLDKAPNTISIAQLRQRIARSLAQEERLAIHPNFFELLPTYLPGVAASEMQLKRETTPGDLTRYCYDVVLHTRAGQSAQTSCGAIGCPDARLAREMAAQGLIASCDEHLEVGVLRSQFNALAPVGLNPAELWKRGASWPAPGVHPSNAFVNNPLDVRLGSQLIPQLRTHLKKSLPEYMIPSQWVILSQMPLTPNGKIDRRALPQPHGRPKEIGEYAAACTELERTLVKIWQEVLRVDHLGTRDNFLDLGGHSLHAMKVIAKTAEQLGVELSIIDVLQFPTVEELAVQLGSRQSEAAGAVSVGTAVYEQGLI
jgi:acyl carrier protein